MKWGSAWSPQVRDHGSGVQGGIRGFRVSDSWPLCQPWPYMGIWGDSIPYYGPSWVIGAGDLCLGHFQVGSYSCRSLIEGLEAL